MSAPSARSCSEGLIAKPAALVGTAASTTGLLGTYTSARSDHYRAELRRRGSYHLAMEIREFLGRDSHAKSKKTCRPFEFRYNQLDGNDFLRSIPSDTSRVLPPVMESTSISAQIFFAYQRASNCEMLPVRRLSTAVFHGARRYYPTPGSEGGLSAYRRRPEVMAELSVASRKIRSDA